MTTREEAAAEIDEILGRVNSTTPDDPLTEVGAELDLEEFRLASHLAKEWGFELEELGRISRSGWPYAIWRRVPAPGDPPVPD